MTSSTQPGIYEDNNGSGNAQILFRGLELEHGELSVPCMSLLPQGGMWTVGGGHEAAMPLDVEANEVGGLMAQRRDSSILTSSIWMVVISLVLFFLPAINGLVGGAVGGYKAGSASRGLGAAVLPAVVVGLVLWGIFAVFNAPVIGFISGVAVGLWALLSSIGMLIGAAIGGAVAPPRLA